MLTYFIVHQQTIICKVILLHPGGTPLRFVFHKEKKHKRCCAPVENRLMRQHLFVQNIKKSAAMPCRLSYGDLQHTCPPFRLCMYFSYIAQTIDALVIMLYFIIIVLIFSCKIDKNKSVISTLDGFTAKKPPKD